MNRGSTMSALNTGTMFADGGIKIRRAAPASACACPGATDCSLFEVRGRERSFPHPTGFGANTACDPEFPLRSGDTAREHWGDSMTEQAGRSLPTLYAHIATNNHRTLLPHKRAWGKAEPPASVLVGKTASCQTLGKGAGKLGRHLSGAFPAFIPRMSYSIRN